MIIQFIENIEIDDTWFHEPQQYAYTGTATVDGVLNYVIEVDDVEYNVPEIYVAHLMQDIPSTDMRNRHQRAVDFIVRDPIPGILGKNDVVLAAKKYLGVDIAAKDRMDQADYDEVALARLEEAKRRNPESTEGREKVGVNETEET